VWHSRDGKAAAARLEDGRENPDGGRLAGAVRAEHAEDLTRSRREGEVVQGDEGSVLLGDPVHLDGQSLARCLHASSFQPDRALR
jgi:hypothetical protein